MICPTSNSAPGIPKQGFSLIELLVVIAVIAITAGLIAPAVIDIARGQGMQRAIADVSGLVEQGRSEAMARSTWTWMGLTMQNVEGQQELLAVLVASKDGTTNTASTNIRAISRPLRVKNVRILPTATHWAVNGTLPLSQPNFGFTQTVQGVAVPFSNTVLGFSPRGEATIDYDAVSPWIEIGLRQMRGNVEVTNQTGSIRVSGFSGQLNVDY